MGPDVVRHILRLIMYLSEAQSEGFGYLWSSFELHPASTTTLSLLGQGTLLDAPKCGSGAYRNTRIWHNLMPHDALMKELARLLPPTRPVDAALMRAGLSRWSTLPTLGAGDQPQPQHTPPPRDPLPYLGTHPNTAPFRVHQGILGRGMLYVADNPSTPPAEVIEALMGFHIGDTAAP